LSDFLTTRREAAGKAGQRPLYAITFHRYRFLTAVERYVPPVLEDLADNVLPSFRRLFRAAPSGDPLESAIVIWDEAGVGKPELWITWRATKRAPDSPWIEPSWVPEFEGHDLDPVRAAFAAAVTAWSITYGLNALWVREEVFSTLRFWLQPGCPRTWCFRGPDPTQEIPPIPRIHIDEPWSFEPWREVRKSLLTRINRFGSEVKEFAKLTSVRPEDMPRKNRDHYRWAALFQCGKLSPKRIADGSRREPLIVESTVTKAVEDLLDLIGLEKRRGKRGPRDQTENVR
jgi:hypothetical protein